MFLKGKTGQKRVPWLVGLLIVGLLGSGIFAYLSLRKAAPKPDLDTQSAVVATGNLAIEIKANGLVQAIRKVNLSPKEAGRIDQLYVDEGAWVRQGELIARMDSEQAQAQVKQYTALLARSQADLEQKQTGTRPEEIAEARARVAAAEASVAMAQAKLKRAVEELQRNQMLAQAGAISQNSIEEFFSQQQEASASLNAELARLREQQQTLGKLRNGTRSEEIAQAKAEVAQAKAQLQFYQTQLDNTFVRAPFSGLITRRFAQEGDFVTPTTSASSTDGATSASIAELSSGLEVEAKVPEASVARINPGQTVEIRADAHPDASFKGQVRLIAPRAVQENNVTSFRVRVALRTGQKQLKSGMNVRLTFLGEPIRNALLIPLAAVVTQKNSQTGVWVSDGENEATFKPITLGSTSGSQAQVLEGLAKGQRILLSPPPGQLVPGIDTMGP
ncbi:efflux RND transporter periplasmic adaptor subunit [Leptolyngbya sp. FACHB-261]|uniref:efflux RND transporter periplasmic adaptor subunit n=1 Tax=Leptolyngbya sp. FACHB-261 TaxID=2692806 RepID=UPI001F5498C5|nr:efflux RND transporter periplasmic adaptor subunit [Leptolyngbya sp. FACHB-261]